MLKRNWRAILTVVGIAALTWAAIGLFSALTWHSTSLENEATNRSNIHRQYAHDRIGSVCLTSIAPPDCIAEANQSARENEREEQDLAAQKITAWWTKVMGIAALIGMGLSAVGVWLVKTTFEETRKSNKIAIAAASSEYGAAFNVTGGHVIIKSGIVFVRLVVKNTGKSPAHHVAITGDYTAFEDMTARNQNFVKDETRVETGTYFSADTIIANAEFSSIHNMWQGYASGGQSKAEVVEGFFRNGKMPAITFDLVLSWATTFSASNKMGIKFTAFEMTFRDRGGNQQGEHEIRDFSYYLVE